jgi:hypothetical protein
MRATDDRYRGEQAKFDLAMRMIGHEARTGTIRYFTGLNDDRIRKLYTTYFKYGEVPVRRQRGVFAHLLFVNGLFSVDAPPGPSLKLNVDLGHRFCECFETFDLLVPRSSLSFEWGFNLLMSMRRGDELGIARCDDCSICYLFDILALPSACPACLLFEERGPIELIAAAG